MTKLNLRHEETYNLLIFKQVFLNLESKATGLHSQTGLWSENNDKDRGQQMDRQG